MKSRKIQRRSKRSKRSKRSRIRHKGGQAPPTVYKFFNIFHYGDQLFNLKFFYDISDVLKANNIIINYYYSPYITNVGELERYVNKDTMKLDSMDHKPPDAIQLWMGESVPDPTQPDGKRAYVPAIDTYFKIFYQEILKKMNLDQKGIDTSLFQKEDYLNDIYNKLDPKFKDLDVLIINGQPQSGQFAYDAGKMDAMCTRLASKYKVATTSPVNDSIVCTMKDGLKLQDIGAISTHAKYIVGILTGPFTPCFNKQAKEYVQKWYILYNGDISFDEIPGKTKMIKTSDNLGEIDL